MRIIKTKQDIAILRRAEVLPEAILAHVKDYVNQLSVELEDEAENQFRLGKNGYIVLLEAGDNVRDLSNVGLSHERNRLLGSCPEYVETLDLGYCQKAYKMAVLYDNDYLMTFFTIASAHDEEVEQWLKDQALMNIQVLFYFSHEINNLKPLYDFIPILVSIELTIGEKI